MYVKEAEYRLFFIYQNIQKTVELINFQFYDASKM